MTKAKAQITSKRKGVCVRRDGKKNLALSEITVSVIVLWRRRLAGFGWLG
jgi:hypothetical protein